MVDGNEPCASWSCSCPGYLERTSTLHPFRMWCGIYKTTSQKGNANKTRIDKVTKVIEFIGFINYDFDVMIRSFPLVQQRYPEVLLLLVGQRYPLTDQIRKQYAIEKGILEVGIVPFQDIPMYLACADILLLPFTDKICNIGRGPINLEIICSRTSHHHTACRRS